jgi:hypothetical protein
LEGSAPPGGLSGGWMTRNGPDGGRRVSLDLWSGLFFALIYFQQHGPVRFSVRFFHRYMFSTTSPVRFSVRSGSFLDDDPLFSATSPVRFSKKVFFFIF